MASRGKATETNTLAVLKCEVLTKQPSRWALIVKVSSTSQAGKAHEAWTLQCISIFNSIKNHMWWIVISISQKWKLRFRENKKLSHGKLWLESQSFVVLSFKLLEELMMTLFFYYQVLFECPVIHSAALLVIYFTRESLGQELENSGVIDFQMKS